MDVSFRNVLVATIESVVDVAHSFTHATDCDTVRKLLCCMRVCHMSMFVVCVMRQRLGEGGKECGGNACEID